MKKLFIIIMGPTGVGKTDFIRVLGRQAPFCIEVINGDMGQLYAPLSIGTAKPDIKNEPLKHHLFSVLDKPRNYTSAEYRKSALGTMQHVWQADAVPAVVGGSGFYIKSLFFPSCELPERDKQQEEKLFKHKSTEELWDELLEIDKERAQTVHPNDRYRLERALTIWYTTGVKPSSCATSFLPIENTQAVILFLTRNRQELYQRISDRTRVMIDQGWIEEVASLDRSWHAFLKEKKLIGYPEIVNFLENGIKDKEMLIELIAQKTRAYAKRQITFWQSFKKLIEAADNKKQVIKKIDEINVSVISIESYIKDLVSELCALQ